MKPIIIISEQEWWRFVVDELATIKETVLTIQSKQEEFMGQVFTDLEALRVALNDATNALAARIEALAPLIKNSMTDEEVEQVKMGFAKIVTDLNVIAADPADPVPNP